MHMTINLYIHIQLHACVRERVRKLSTKSATRCAQVVQKDSTVPTFIAWTSNANVLALWGTGSRFLRGHCE